MSPRNRALQKALEGMIDRQTHSPSIICSCLLDCTFCMFLYVDLLVIWLPVIACLKNLRWLYFLYCIRAMQWASIWVLLLTSWCHRWNFRPQVLLDLHHQTVFLPESPVCKFLSAKCQYMFPVFRVVCCGIIAAEISVVNFAVLGWYVVSYSSCQSRLFDSFGWQIWH